MTDKKIINKTSKQKQQKHVDFIGIGAAKSGSSWVGECLDEHPQINFDKHKSIFFFNADSGNQYLKDNWSNYHRGIDWYLNRLGPVEESKIRGEFGVSYLNDPVACERIKKHFPDTKLLVSLRDPVDMIYSLYWYATNTVEIKPPDTFRKAVDEGFYLDRGKYYKYIKPYFESFQRENIHVIIFDDIKSEPRKVVKDLYTFLGVDPAFEPSVLFKKVYPAIGHRFDFLKDDGYLFFSFLRSLRLEKVRRFFLDTPVFYKIYEDINIVPKKYPPMDEDIRERLKKYYKEDIEKLEGLINRNLDAWK